MQSKFLHRGIIFAGLAVLLGAFGAHALKQIVLPDQLVTFDTGVRYQMYHAIALILLGIFEQQESISNKTFNNPFIKRVGLFFTLGILFFSGSIYLLTFKNQLPFSVIWAGPVTPIGGLFFILGWVSWSVYLIKKK
jgi:uncharacterized membrane protein YgdD (TMEM256/DUF423 family)